MLTEQRQPAVIPLGWITAPQARPTRFALGIDHDPWIGDTEPVLQAVEAFLATIRLTAAQAIFVAENR
jgi:hypothetical protein